MRSRERLAQCPIGCASSLLVLGCLASQSVVNQSILNESIWKKMLAAFIYYHHSIPLLKGAAADAL
jgi:hypothetical protein